MSPLSLGNYIYFRKLPERKVTIFNAKTLFFCISQLFLYKTHHIAFKPKINGMPSPSLLDSSKMLALLRLQYEAENWEAALNQRQTDTQEIFLRHLRRCSYREDRGRHELEIEDRRTYFNLAKHSKLFPGRNDVCDRHSCLWGYIKLEFWSSSFVRTEYFSGNLPVGSYFWHFCCINQSLLQESWESLYLPWYLGKVLNREKL